MIRNGDATLSMTQMCSSGNKYYSRFACIIFFVRNLWHNNGYYDQQVQFMESKECSYQAIFAWSVAVLFYFYQFLLQVVPSVLKPEIQETFNLTSQQFGSMAAYFLYAYAFMQIPAGLLLDRYGPRYVLPPATIVCAAGAALFGMATDYHMAVGARILSGIGSAFAVIGCFKVAAMQFSPKHFSLMTGLTVMIGMSGAAFAQGFVGPIVNSMPQWQDIFQIFGVVGCILAVSMCMFIPTHASHKVSEVKSFARLKTELWCVLSNSCTWVAALYAGLMYVPTLGLGEAWGIAFLVEGHGLTRDVAHKILPTLFMGWAVGSIMFGFLAEFCARSWLMTASSFIVGCLCWTILQPFTVGLSMLSWITLFFVLGLFSAGFILAFTSVKESNPEEMAATSSGVMNTMNTLCGAFAQQRIGASLDYQLMIYGRTVPILEDYQHALYLIVYAMIGSFVLSMVLNKIEPMYAKSSMSV